MISIYSFKTSRFSWQPSIWHVLRHFCWHGKLLENLRHNIPSFEKMLNTQRQENIGMIMTIILLLMRDDGDDVTHRSYDGEDG